jgi:hypothetical protein
VKNGEKKRSTCLRGDDDRRGVCYERTQEEGEIDHVLCVFRILLSSSSRLLSTRKKKLLEIWRRIFTHDHKTITNLFLRRRRKLQCSIRFKASDDDNTLLLLLLTIMLLI